MMGSSAEVAQVRDAKVQAVEARIKEEDIVRAIEGVQLILMEDWFDDSAQPDYLLRYCNAVSAPIKHHGPRDGQKTGTSIFSTTSFPFPKTGLRL